MDRWTSFIEAFIVATWLYNFISGLQKPSGIAKEVRRRIHNNLRQGRDCGDSDPCPFGLSSSVAKIVVSHCMETGCYCRVKCQGRVDCAWILTKELVTEPPLWEWMSRAILYSVLGFWGWDQKTTRLNLLCQLSDRSAYQNTEGELDSGIQTYKELSSCSLIPPQCFNMCKH